MFFKVKEYLISFVSMAGISFKLILVVFQYNTRGSGAKLEVTCNCLKFFAPEPKFFHEKISLIPLW